MGYVHDQQAHAAGGFLLNELRQGIASWATPRLTPTTTLSPGVLDWPRPDETFEDPTTGASLALEFKPAGQSKREYVTGLGQAITYLRMFEYAALIVPALDRDGGRIGEYLQDTLNESYAQALPVALFQYDQNPADLSVQIPLRSRQNPPPPPSGRSGKVFWAYWRDLSQFDIYALLRIVDAQDTPNFSSAYSSFWSRFMSAGQARTWNGSLRRISPGRSGRPEEANAQISFRHLGLISSDGNLTTAGYDLLRLGRTYQPNSLVFMQSLCNRLLTTGKHLELIFWVEDCQRTLLSANKLRSKDFFMALDMKLQQEGVMPAAPPSGGKSSYIRDEPKLWNKFSLLVRRPGGNYFHPGIGFVFDWRAIIAAMSN